MLNAIASSKSGVGTLTQPSVASERVTECPSVNDVIVATSARQPDTSSTRPITKTTTTLRITISSGVHSSRPSRSGSMAIIQRARFAHR